MAKELFGGMKRDRYRKKENERKCIGFGREYREMTMASTTTMMIKKEEEASNMIERANWHVE